MSIYEKGNADVYIRNPVEGYPMLDGIVPAMRGMARARRRRGAVNDDGS